MTTFGEKLLALRKAAGLSQEELAEKINVTRQSVSKWENGAVLPETETLLALSRLFGVSVDALLSPDPLPDAVERAPEEAPQAEPETGTADPPTPAPERSRNGKRTFILIAAIAAAAVLLAFAAGLFFHGRTAPAAPQETEAPTETTTEAPAPEPVKTFCVLVHGMGGWGENSEMNGVGHYWGADTGDLPAYLRAQGYDVYVPSVGPISSAWDRACELYAQLTGSRVDYGAAHAAACGHERYGRTYNEPMVPQWDAKHQADLVGHSFGGETVRLLTSLLTYGDDAEKAAGAEDLSPLFEGGHGDLVHSVTALCSPHNGSSLTCMVDTFGKYIGLGSTTQLLARLCLTMAGATDSLSGVYDFMLDQFGIGDISGGLSEITAAIGAVFDHNNDNAGYDLTPDGAAELNARIRMNENAYYLSYPYCTTEASAVTAAQKPLASTLPVLSPLATAMGAYTGTTPGGIKIDDTWRANDGLVNVVSAQYPTGDPHADWTGETALQKGIWNVAPVKTGHHGTVIGLGADAGATHAFYTDLLSMLGEQESAE